MITKFDEEKTREELRDFAISYAHNTDFNPSRPMGNVARSTIGIVLSSAFVGMLGEMRGVLPKCKAWLEGAIAQRERLGPSVSYHLSLLSQALAITTWLMDGTVDRHTWAQSAKYDKAAIQDAKIYSVRDARSLRLDHVVSIAVIAGDFDMAIFEYEESLGKEPVKIGRAVTPRVFSYMVARLGLEPASREELFSWGRKIVASKLDDWLSRGQFIDAATFVCLVYSIVGGRKNAEDALLLAIEDAKLAA
jgi:hypothetical protein